MEPRAVLRPVGPERPAVYWRRRVVALAVLLLVVLLAAKACGGGGNQTVRSSPPTTTPSSRPTVSPAATGKPSATARPVAACAPGSIEVTGRTDATSYPAGTLPRLTMRVTNTSKAACSVVVSEAARHFTVFSGADRVWSTDDCPHPGAVVRTTLRAGAAIAYARTWDRHRSAQGCASPGAAAQPGTYRFVAGLGDAQSVEAVFHLTG